MSGVRRYTSTIHPRKDGSQIPALYFYAFVVVVCGGGWLLLITKLAISHLIISPFIKMFGLQLARSSVIAFLSGSAAPTTIIRNTRTFSKATKPLSAINYLLKYEYIPEVLEKRGPYREGHLNLAKKMIAEDKCLSGGPSGEPGVEVPSGALFVFTDLESAQEYASNDPYVANGIVTKYTIEEWNVVVQKE